MSSAIKDIQNKKEADKICLHCWKIGDLWHCNFYPMTVPQDPSFQFTNKCTSDDWKVCPFK